MADYEISGVVTLDNQEANNAMDETKQKAESSSDGMSESFGKIADAVIAAFAIDKIVSFGQACVDAYGVQETAELQLETILKNKNGASDKQIQQMKTLASEVQKYGVVGDEVTLSGQKQLAMFTNNTDTIAKLTPLMDDLAVSQDGYNVSSSTTQSMAKAIGKAMNGTTTQLERMGVTFTDAQKEVLKTGTEEEKTAVLTEALGSSVGGMNKKFAETDTGKIQQAKNDFGDFQEVVGGLVTGALSGLYTWLDGVVGKLSEFVTWLGQGSAGASAIRGVIEVLAIGVGALVTAFGAYKAIMLVVNGVQTLFNALMGANPIVQVAIAIGALIAVLIALYNNCTPFRDFVNSLISQLQPIIDMFVQNVITIFNTLWTFIQTYIIPIIQQIADFWVATFNFLLPILQGIFSGIQTIFSVAFNFIKGIWNAFSPWFIGLFNVISAPIQAVFNIIKSIFTTAWNAIKAVWDGVGGFFSGIVNAIKQPFNSIKSFFSSTFSSVVNAILGFFKAGGNIFKTVTDGFGKIFTGIVNGMIGGIETMINFPINGINKVLKAIKNFSLPLGIGKVFYGIISTIDKVKVPRLARGGVVNGSTLANVGEDGAEAIVPLENNTGWIKKTAEQLQMSLNAKAPTIQNVEIISAMNNQTMQINALANAMNDFINVSTTYYEADINKSSDIQIDGDSVVDKTIDRINDKLNQIKLKEGRGVL